MIEAFLLSVVMELLVCFHSNYSYEMNHKNSEHQILDSQVGKIREKHAHSHDVPATLLL